VTTRKRDNLGRLWDREVPLYNLVSCYKSSHKISSVYCVYELCKGFIKVYQKSEVSLMLPLFSPTTERETFSVWIPSTSK